MLSVSVVATVRDEAETIDRFISALERQTRRPDQVVVVDGGSSDGTVAALEAWAARSSVPVVVHEAPGTNISAGRNLAIARAEGEVIAVTDAGAVADERWLERLSAPFAHASVEAVSGFYVAGGESWFGRCLTTVITPQLPEIEPDEFLPSSRSVAFRKRLWERVGGYPEQLDHCEDIVFDLAIRDAGVRFQFEPDAIVTWNGRSSARAFARQYYYYARGDGHALLWPKRHAARYAAYVTGLWLLVSARRRTLARLGLVGGSALHFWRYWRRVFRAPGSGSRLGRAAAFALVPVIVVTGDVAKMVGYLVGRTQPRDLDEPSPATAPQTGSSSRSRASR